MRSSSPVTENAQIDLDQFIGKIAQAQVSCLLLDYDGTLAPFSIDRGRAFPYPGVVPLLRKIMATGRTRLAIVTGRSASEVLPLLGLDPTPEVWGAHGLERLRPNGIREVPPLRAEVSQALADAGQWLTDQRLEHFAEYKPGGIAVHWRGVSEPSAADIRSRVLEGWFPLTENKFTSLLEFDCGIEIRVAGFDKGRAIRTIISEMNSDTPIAYLGDDATDERAFKALGTRGLSILVRPQRRRSSARLWLKPPADLVDFLSRWVKACGEIVPQPAASSIVRELTDGC